VSSKRVLIQAGAFALGALYIQTQATLPDECYTQLMPLAVVLWLRLRKTHLPLACALLLCLGALYAAVDGHVKMRAAVSVLQGPRDVVVIGTIDSFVSRGMKSSTFQLKVHQVAETSHHLRMRVRWYGVMPNVQPGEVWRLKLRVRPLTARFNPGGFDRAGWLWQQGITLAAYVRDAETAALMGRTMWSTSRWRDRLSQRISTLLVDAPRIGLVKALLIGDRREISERERAILRQTGTAHLVAISGLHVGLAAGCGFVLVNMMWRRCGRLAERYASARVAAAAALGTATIYAALAGFSLPTERALVMCVVVLGGLLSRRRVPSTTAFAIGVATLVLVQPAGVASAGFWLSCGAVAVLIYGLQGRSADGRVYALLRAQWVAGLGLAPLTLLFFGQTPTIGVVANAIAVPLVGMLIVPVLLFGGVALAITDSLAAPLLMTGATLLDWMFVLLDWLAEHNVSVRATAEIATLKLALAGAGAALILSRLPGRTIGLLLWLPLFAARPETPPPGSFTAIVLDVGQGLAVVVRTNNHTLLFDTGPRFGRYSAAKSLLLPAFESLHIDRLDVLLVSHRDNDHAGGADIVLRNLPVGLYMGDASVRIREPRVCRAGQAWTWDGVQFAVLHPRADTRGSRNNRSCVLRVSSGQNTLLLPADIEAQGEQALLASNTQLSAADKVTNSDSGGLLEAKVLVAPHHGSQTSSTESFVRAVAPTTVVYSAGAGNRYAMPHAPVVARYQRLGVRQLNTAIDGAVMMTFAPNNTTIRSYASAARRYWHLRVNRQ
jgi:competence protein ComEC